MVDILREHIIPFLMPIVFGKKEGDRINSILKTHIARVGKHKLYPNLETAYVIHAHKKQGSGL